MPERDASHGVLAVSAQIVGRMLLAWAIVTGLIAMTGLTLIDDVLEQWGVPFPKWAAGAPFILTSVGLAWGYIKHSRRTLLVANVVGGISCLASALWCMPMWWHYGAVSGVSNWTFMACLFLVQAVLVADCQKS